MYEVNLQQYNNAVDAFNSGTISEEQFEEYEKAYEQFKEYITQYEETLNLLETE
jgi:hypothetical protein